MFAMYNIFTNKRSQKGGESVEKNTQIYETPCVANEHPTASHEAKSCNSGTACDGGEMIGREGNLLSAQTDYGKTARKIFEDAEASAATVIVEMMKSDGSSNSLKVDCAKEILTRLHGKTFEDEDTVDLSALLPFDLKDYCD